MLTEDLGLVPGNRVLLRGGNSVAMALAWLAVVKAGLIAVATMPLLRAKELGEIIEKAQPVAALCDGQACSTNSLIAQQAHPVLATVIAFNKPDADDSLSARAAKKSGVFKACPTAADDIALLAFTSGHHRQAQGAGHHPPRRARDVRDLAAPRAAARAATTS